MMKSYLIYKLFTEYAILTEYILFEKERYKNDAVMAHVPLDAPIKEMEGFLKVNIKRLANNHPQCYITLNL